MSIAPIIRLAPRRRRWRRRMADVIGGLVVATVAAVAALLVPEHADGLWMLALGATALGIAIWFARGSR